MKFVMMENKEKELNFDVCTYKQYAVGKRIELWSVDIGNILTEKTNEIHCMDHSLDIYDFVSQTHIQVHVYIRVLLFKVL